jgi:hypothetical protein
MRIRVGYRHRASQQEIGGHAHRFLRSANDADSSRDGWCGASHVLDGQSRRWETARQEREDCRQCGERHRRRLLREFVH